MYASMIATASVLSMPVVLPNLPEELEQKPYL